MLFVRRKKVSPCLLLDLLRLQVAPIGNGCFQVDGITSVKKRFQSISQSLRLQFRRNSKTNSERMTEPKPFADF